MKVIQSWQILRNCKLTPQLIYQAGKDNFIKDQRPKQTCFQINETIISHMDVPSNPNVSHLYFIV